MKYTESFYNMLIKEDVEYKYIYNTYSGAYVKLETEVYKQVHNKVIEKSNPCLYFSELIKQGIIKPIELNEVNRIILNERAATLNVNEEKLSLVIAPTSLCNLNCVYCFENEIKNKKTIPIEKIRDVVDFIFTHINDKVKHVHIGWFGGEPMLAYEVILEFYRLFEPICLEKGISYSSSMITNGTLLSEDKVKILSNQCKLNKVQITIDGTQEVYCRLKRAKDQQFNQVVKNIKNALQFVDVSIRLHSNKDNYEDLKIVSKQIIDLCGRTKKLQIYLAKLEDYCGSKDKCYFDLTEFETKNIEFNRYLCELENKPVKFSIPRYRKTFCRLYCLNNFVIGPEGELYKCEHYIGKKDKVVGDIYTGYYYNEEMLSFLANPIPEKCKECKLFPICVSGCPAQKGEFGKGYACYVSENYIRNLLKDYKSQGYDEDVR